MIIDILWDNGLILFEMKLGTYHASVRYISAIEQYALEISDSVTGTLVSAAALAPSLYKDGKRKNISVISLSLSLHLSESIQVKLTQVVYTYLDKLSSRQVVQEWTPVSETFLCSSGVDPGFFKRGGTQI